MIPGSPEVARDAAATLEELDGLRHRTRQDLQGFWFPLVLFGSLTLVSLPLSNVGDGVGAAVFWAIAAPAGTLLTGRWYHRRAQQVGASRPPRPYFVVALGMTAGAFILPLLVPDSVAGISPAFAIAAGYLAFARLERMPGLALLAVGIAAVPIAVVAAGVGDRDIVTWAVIGLALLVSGLALRRTDPALDRAAGLATS